MKPTIALSIVLNLAATHPVFAISCGLNATERHSSRHDGNRWIYRDTDSLFFTSSMAVNTDGAPSSYHPDDPDGTAKAINTICNGANATLANGRTVNYAQCGALLTAFRTARQRGFNPALRPRINFYAVATRGGRPCTITTGPYAGYFVSTTSATANQSLGVCEQGRYLDALALPFVIYPGHRTFTGAGVNVGDVAVTYNPATDVLEYGIVGDRGPAWGLAEGSVFLAKTLRNISTDPRTRRDTYRYSVSRAHTLLLPRARISPPYTLAKIREEGRAAFEAWGGRARFNDCVRTAGARP